MYFDCSFNVLYHIHCCSSLQALIYSFIRFHYNFSPCRTCMLLFAHLIVSFYPTARVKSNSSVYVYVLTHNSENS